MPEMHAKLSASGSSRWINCPPSVVLESGFPESVSPFAEEGTKAHDLAEKKLLKFVEKKRKKIPCDDKEMDYYTDAYKDYCIEVYNRLRKACKDAILLVEQRLDFSRVVPGGFGTGDCVIISDKELHVIDLKYGKGVEVAALNNSQLRLYALGAMEAFSLIYNFDTVVVHIMQPRINNVVSESLKVEELNAWAEEVVKPAASLADKGEGEVVSGRHCKFCKASAVCRKRKEVFMELFKYENKDPRLLTLDELEEVLNAGDDLVKWIEKVKQFALEQVLAGNEVPGYKAVEGRSIRRYADESAIATTLKNNGYEEALIYQKKLLTITEMTKLIGKKDFDELLGGLIEKPVGKPTLVPLSDKREALKKETADEDFADLLD